MRAREELSEVRRPLICYILLFIKMFLSLKGLLLLLLLLLLLFYYSDLTVSTLLAVRGRGFFMKVIGHQSGRG